MVDNLLNKRKKVCVVLSSYNGEKYIKDQIDSILSQNGSSIFLYIRDDGSSDNTVKIIDEYASINTNICVDKGKNVGFNRSFWLATKAALDMLPECQYFAFSDQDDKWDSKKISVAVDALEEKSDIPLLYYSNLSICDCNLKYMHEMFNNNIVKSTYEQSLGQVFCYGCTAVFNRCCALLYTKNYYYYPHDCWTFYICMFCGKTFYDRKSYISYRRHGGNYGSGGNKLSFESKKNLSFLIKKVKQIQNSKPFFSDMANTLLSDYKEFVNPDAIGILMPLAYYRYNIKHKLKVLFTNYIRTGRIGKNVTIRAYALFNKL